MTMTQEEMLIEAGLSTNKAHQIAINLKEITKREDIKKKEIKESDITEPLNSFKKKK